MRLTDEQDTVANHVPGAFVEACPGAGKTRAIVARIARIAPTLNTPDVVATMASEVMPTVREERHLRIHVGSGAVEATREMLQRWQDAHPETGAAQVLTEPRLAPFCCIVESELGRVELSLDPAPAASSPDTFFWP